MTQRQKVSIERLRAAGIEVLPRDGSHSLQLPTKVVLEAPSSLKWMDVHHSLHLGAFSYHVSGYCFAARIGRYCSIGEDVQIGRQNHPMTWASTSPAFYLGQKMFDVGRDFRSSEKYDQFKANPRQSPTQVQVTTIGNDVWIGHGAYIAAGVNIADGAVVGAHSVVTKDVAPFSIVAGNPARHKKTRVPAELLSPLLRCKWWRFAPWQLDHLDPTDLHSFVSGVFKMQACDQYQPSKISLSTNGALVFQDS